VKKGNFFVLGMLAIVLAFGFALAGCSTEADEITDEEAFTEVWKYFGSPNRFTFDDGQVEAFTFYDESFNSTDLQAVKTYWDSLPNTFYKERWGPDEGGVQNLRFDMQIRKEKDGTTYLVIVIFSPGEHISLARIVPGKAMEITRTMVERVK
jgi:hypothetical protein